MFGLATISLPEEYRSEPYYFVAKNHPATTVGEIDRISDSIEFDDSTATYRFFPVDGTRQQDIFISPLIRTVPVTITASVLGRVSPLPIDDQIIDFG